MLLVHAMAHSVINDAPLNCVPGEEGLAEIASSVADELQECCSAFTLVVSLLKQLATLNPD